MQVRQVRIAGFRGIQSADIALDRHAVLIGTSNAGKSTLIEALALALGRDRMHARALSEHDFFGCDPQPADRIRIVVTLVGFGGNDPDRSREWFSDQAGVEKWWQRGRVHATRPNRPGAQLCLQIGYCARFDHEDLEVEALRYFCDADEDEDPFERDDLRRISRQRLQDIGFFLVPARRTWDRTISFNSELFRRVIRTLSDLPAAALLRERDRLREPDCPVEQVDGFQDLVARMNANLADLVPGQPELRLRITETDSDSLLRSLVPHFCSSNEPSLPVRRHGTGLVSLQTLLLLLELGRARRVNDQSFILALEEPEIHLPLGAQRRIIHKLLGTTSQLLVTTHAPAIAALVQPEHVHVLTNTEGAATAPQLTIPVDENAPNAIRKLFHDYRAELLDALMHPVTIVPEGRIDYEWLRLLQRVVAVAVPCGDTGLDESQIEILSKAAEIGVVRTHDGAVLQTYERLAPLKLGILPLLDGDKAGVDYVRSLVASSRPPTRVLVWPIESTIEDAIGWILSADAVTALSQLEAIRHLEERPDTVDDLVALLKSDHRADGGLKQDYLAYDDLASIITDIPACVSRVQDLLLAIHTASTATDPSGNEHLSSDSSLSSPAATVLRWQF